MREGSVENDDLGDPRVKGLGLQLMAIGGFSRYMEHVGASNALFEVFKKPLSMIKSPYILLGAAFLVSQVMAIFVPSHAGLALLLMVTLYPLLVRSGVSQMSALGMIGCAQYVDAGPGSGNCNMAAQVAGMDVSEYFVYYQLPLFVAVTLIVCVTHMIVQRWWDKKEGWTFDPNNIATLAGSKASDADANTPKIYAILPIIPLFLIIFFSKVAGSSIRMDVVTAMLISTIVAICFELVRHRKVKEVFASLKLFYEGMGKILVSVVSLIVCGEFFVWHFLPHAEVPRGWPRFGDALLLRKCEPQDPQYETDLPWNHLLGQPTRSRQYRYLAPRYTPYATPP